MSADIDALLRLDPLALAEDLTGKSYKDDEETMQTGFGLHLIHNQRKREVLQAAGDTHFTSTLAEQLQVFHDLGFEQVLSDTFTGKSWNDEAAPEETYTVLWHPDGILGTVESYGTTGRNSAKIYYNWIPNGDADRWSVTSSGGYRENDEGVLVWVGDHDAREALRHKVERLREAGTFVTPWVERPFLWLLTYMDTKGDGYDYGAINDERISRLPQGVRDAIGKGD